MNGFAFAVAVLNTTLKAERAATADHATAAAAERNVYPDELVKDLERRKRQRAHEYNAQLGVCTDILQATFWPTAVASTEEAPQE